MRKSVPEHNWQLLFCFISFELPSSLLLLPCTLRARRPWPQLQSVWQRAGQWMSHPIAQTLH